MRAPAVPALDVRAVDSEADRSAFLRLPWSVYRRDPAWVPPLWAQQRRRFDLDANAELDAISMQPMLAWRGQRPVGSIVAFVDAAYDRFHDSRTGWFGALEVEDDAEACHALLAAAERWLVARGARSLVGPATFGTSSEIGVPVDHFDEPPILLLTHAPHYLPGMLAAYPGMTAAMDMWAWRIDGNDWGGRKADRIPHRVQGVVERVRKRADISVRHLDLRHFDREVAHIKAIYNAAFVRNWGFAPVSERHADQIAEDLRQIIDPRVAVFAEVAGEPVAFGVSLPNLNVPLRRARCRSGEPHWWQLAKLAWHWKIRPLRSVRVWAAAVVPQWRGIGLDALIYHEMIVRGLAAGYHQIEMSWVLANNDMMNRAIARMGATRHRTYRV